VFLVTIKLNPVFCKLYVAQLYSVLGVVESTASDKPAAALCPPGVTSKEVEDAFPIHTHTHTEHMYTFCVYTFTQPGTEITGRDTQHSHEHSISGLALLPSLAEQERDLHVRIYTQT